MAGGLAGLLLLASNLAWAQGIGLGQGPESAQWQVLTVQPGSGGPACMLTIADPASPPSNPTRWSLRFRPGELLVIENSIAVGGATITTLTFSVDAQAFGPLPITERHYAPENTPSVVKYVSAIAKITGEAEVARAVAALHPGSTIRIARRGRDFAERLGAAAASAFAACRRGLTG